MVSNSRLRRDVAIGVDGCPGGWVAAVWRPQQSNLTMQVVNSLATLIEEYPDVAIGVDIPIGLAASEPRACDIAARRLLGRSRASSVFPAPCRGILRLDASYAVTSARSKELTTRGISKQTYHIIPKIAEADDVVSPAMQKRMFEVHPEVSFWALAGGRPMEHAKKRSAGFNERRGVLRRVFPHDAIPENRREARALVAKSKSLGRGAGADDVLDAIVAAWTAQRFARSEARHLPEQREIDQLGLAIEIVY